MADRNPRPRVEIRGYSLWLERISALAAKTQRTAGLRVTSFAIKGTQDSVATGGGAGPGKATFDTLQLTIAPETGLEFAQLSRAQDTGANTGKGRLDAILSSGCSRHLLSFEDSMVNAVSALAGQFDDAQFELRLDIDELKLLWEPIRQ